MVQSNLEQRTLKRSLIQVATSILDTPILTRPGKALLGSGRLRAWVRRQKWKLKLAFGYRLVPEEALTSRYREALLWLQEQEGPELAGDYLEFGVFNGTSLNCMYRALKELGLRNVRLFGFDSFEGLPASAADDEWVPGSYQIDYEFTRRWLTRRGVDWQRVTLVKGWFSDTLTQALIDDQHMKRASVIMFDCDAYESTREALAFSHPLIREWAVVFFDDWYSGGRAERSIGEKQAFEEFLRASPQFEVEDFGSYNLNSQVFKLVRQTSD